jgi:hypothetical protein
MIYALAWMVDETGLQPLFNFAANTWGVAPGWYEPAPLALAKSPWAKGPYYTSMGQRPMYRRHKDSKRQRRDSSPRRINVWLSVGMTARWIIRWHVGG